MIQKSMTTNLLKAQSVQMSKRRNDKRQTLSLLFEVPGIFAMLVSPTRLLAASPFSPAIARARSTPTKLPATQARVQMALPFEFPISLYAFPNL